MAKVAFVGLGVMGYPMAGHLKTKGGHDVTVFNRTAAKAEKWVAQYGGKSAPTPKEAAAGQDFVMACVGNDNDLREVMLGQGWRLRRRAQRRRRRRSHHRFGRNRARALRGGKKARLRFHRRAGVRRPGRRRERRAHGDVRRRCGAVRQAEKVIAAYARACNLIGASGSGQLAKMVNQICIAGVVQGLAEALHFAQKAEPRHREADRHHLQRRRAILADGKPLQDHGRRQIRFRLCGRLDAQGPRHLPCRSAQKRRASAAHRAGRSVLFGSAEDGRPALGHVEPDRAAAAMKEPVNCQSKALHLGHRQTAPRLCHRAVRLPIAYQDRGTDEKDPPWSGPWCVGREAQRLGKTLTKEGAIGTPSWHA